MIKLNRHFREKSRQIGTEIRAVKEEDWDLCRQVYRAYEEVRRKYQQEGLVDDASHRNYLILAYQAAVGKDPLRGLNARMIKEENRAVSMEELEDFRNRGRIVAEVDRMSTAVTCSFVHAEEADSSHRQLGLKTTPREEIGPTSSSQHGAAASSSAPAAAHNLKLPLPPNNSPGREQQQQHKMKKFFKRLSDAERPVHDSLSPIMRHRPDKDDVPPIWRPSLVTAAGPQRGVLLVPHSPLPGVGAVPASAMHQAQAQHSSVASGSAMVHQAAQAHSVASGIQPPSLPGSSICRGPGINIC